MEESPHKCPVCNRSFNQRSNLKTHLLTHTDHKPYECSSCGKVFRRNCDLRRHALTHTVGDVPSEVLDVGEEDQHNLSGDEDETVLEVDSPVHSPALRHRSPSPPMDMPVSAELEDDREEDDEERAANESDQIPVVQCHHERPQGSKSPYTMRPQNDNQRSHHLHHPNHPNADDQPQTSSQGVLLGQQNDMFMPTLHVRRDLHHKMNILSRSSTITSGLMEPGASYLSSIPIRKRPIGPDGEPHPIISRNIISSHIMAPGLGLRHHHQLLKPPDELIKPSLPPPDTNTPLLSPASSTSSSMMSPRSHISSPSLQLPPPPQATVPPVPINLANLSNIPTNLVLPNGLPPGQQPQQPNPTQSTPRKTGFSIEDIMRR